MGRKDDDIVERLRDQAQAPALAWLTEAANEIERLREINRILHTECDRMHAERRA